MSTDLFSQAPFLHALADYFYLINNQYPEKGSLKLVGDRYKLPSTMRTVLYRGISSDKKNKDRFIRLVDIYKNQFLIVDGYNVSFSILNYKLGRLVFISSDGICRDAGSLFGRINNQEYFIETLSQLISYLVFLRPKHIHIYFDSPISYSLNHKNIVEVLLNKFHLEGIVEVVKSADASIKMHTEGIICTSDSAIIDNSKLPVADLAFDCIAHYYNPDLLNIRNILNDIQV